MPLVAFCPSHFLADFIICMCVFDCRQAQETAVNCALHHGTSVLWIARTDELCEQAVQSFRQVWANRGRPWTDLRIFRLWGGNPNPAAPDEDVPSVVVASIQTLIRRRQLREGGRFQHWSALLAL